MEQRIEMKKKKKKGKRLGTNHGFFPNPAENPLGKKGTTIMCIPSNQKEKRKECSERQKPENG